MSNVGQIWPRWHRAKHLLVEALMDADRKDIPRIMNDFFERTIFNFNQAFSVDREVMEHRLKDPKEAEEFWEWHRNRIGMAIGARIMKDNLFFSDVIEDTPYRHTVKFSILIVGVPRFIQDQKGNIRYIRD